MLLCTAVVHVHGRIHAIVALGSRLVFCLCLGLAFCVFIRFLPELYVFVVLDVVFFQYYAERWPSKNFSEMTYFVSSGT